ncbi:beta-ketoacyl synthase N-terminal-like domain-containing protein [Colwelliaceae bacterium 6441]
MKNFNSSEVIITGLGVTSSIGQGQQAFSDSLLAGKHNFNIMQRPGRQYVSTNAKGDKETSQFLGAEINELSMPQSISNSLLRTASFSSHVALATLNEAWHDAQLDNIAADRIGLVIGGSNFQQRDLLNTQHKYQHSVPFIRPTYAMSFMDSDLCGLCTEVFDIKGLAYTVGGASASGQVAIIQAIEAVRSGQVDVCIAMGALMDLSYWECQGFRSLGAMGSDRYADKPAAACRPFDQDRDGFIFGESCGVVVIEKADRAEGRRLKPYARLSGWAMGMDANRNPNPSFEGEVNVIEKALKQANLTPDNIDYINPHGTGSHIGDITELKALRHCQLDHAYINATKSILGHGLSAAGTVEIIATLLQMKAGKLHPTKNLENPMEADYNWVQHQAVTHASQRAINLSMGFGGMNTAICLEKI